jgi:hypothetical protein
MLAPNQAFQPSTINIVETDLLAALRSFILVSTGFAQDHVIRGRVNGVPMPVGPFVVIASSRVTPWRTNIEYFDAPNNAIDLNAGMQATFQCDCYGAGSMDTAIKLSVALRSAYAQQFFPAGTASMFASDPLQLTFVNSEEQYEERWSFDAVLAYNPTIEVPQDYFASVDIGLKPVDVYYPPDED